MISVATLSLFLLICNICTINADDYEISNQKFPDDFMFGTATASYQVEGAWNEDGKTENMWDNVTHRQPDFIDDRSNGDVACDSYHKYKEDVAMLKTLGVNHYRFSLAWNRILPNGKFFYCHIFQISGKVGITLDTSAFVPASNSSEDKVAAATMYDFELGVYANPIYHGDYPEIVKTRVEIRSKMEGRQKSRLPVFTAQEKAYIKGTHDFFGVNIYTGELVEPLPEPPSNYPVSKYADQSVNSFQPDTWEKTLLGYFKVVPWTVRYLLRWIKERYDDPEIIIAENGYPDAGGLQDEKRLSYIREYLSHIRDAMIEDKVKVFGYTVWSLMDNFEWTSGYTIKFGIYQVDFNNPNRNRTQKLSAEFFQKVCKTRCLVDVCEN
nr:myrosinase 1-like [Leptinotarsa decemlineata]